MTRRDQFADHFWRLWSQHASITDSILQSVRLNAAGDLLEIRYTDTGFADEAAVLRGFRYRYDERQTPYWNAYFAVLEFIDPSGVRADSVDGVRWEAVPDLAAVPPLTLADSIVPPEDVPI